jgi:TetR/AcrR family transcriptional repressor of mexJK operon
MDEIAHDVGLGKASLYYYFPTKRDVIRGVVDRELRQFVLELERSLKAPATAPEKLRMYAERRSMFFRQLINLASLSEWSNWRPMFRDLFADLALAEERVLVPVLRDGRRSGELDVRSPDRMARLIVHVLQGLRIRYLRDHRPGLTEGASDDLERESVFCIEVLLTGIARNQRR